MAHGIHIGRPSAPGSKPTPIQPHKEHGSGAAGSFAQVLDQVRAQPVRISGHARDRLAAGRRDLSEAEMGELVNAVDRAAQKGAKDALILMRDLALVVSVRNRTVITAVDGARVKENIFTNIDSAVIL